jgi:hypothetical protein
MLYKLTTPVWRTTSPSMVSSTRRRLNPRRWCLPSCADLQAAKLLMKAKLRDRGLPYLELYVPVNVH